MREFKDSVTGVSKPEPHQTSTLPAGTTDTAPSQPLPTQPRENEHVS
jgi:hypothetical protein